MPHKEWDGVLGCICQKATISSSSVVLGSVVALFESHDVLVLSGGVLLHKVEVLLALGRAELDQAALRASLLRLSILAHPVVHAAHQAVVVCPVERVELGLHGVHLHFLFNYKLGTIINQA